MTFVTPRTDNVCLLLLLVLADSDLLLETGEAKLWVLMGWG